MRDIRSDLQERAKLIEGQISSAYTHFEKVIEQLQSEHDARVAEFKSELAVERIRELPDGTFAPITLSEVIRLRRVI
jgi:hypothetical protein